MDFPLGFQFLSSMNFDKWLQDPEIYLNSPCNLDSMNLTEILLFLPKNNSELCDILFPFDPSYFPMSGNKFCFFLIQGSVTYLNVPSHVSILLIISLKILFSSLIFY